MHRWIRRGVAWDAFGDHTTNPADTTYTITTPGMWAGCCWTATIHGGVPRAKLVEAARSLLDTTETSGGPLHFVLNERFMTRTSRAFTT